MLRAEGTFGAATALNLFAERCAGRGRPLGFVVVAGQHVELLPDLSSGRGATNMVHEPCMQHDYLMSEQCMTTCMQHDSLHSHDLHSVFLVCPFLSTS